MSGNSNGYIIFGDGTTQTTAGDVYTNTPNTFTQLNTFNDDVNISGYHTLTLGYQNSPSAINLYGNLNFVNSFYGTITTTGSYLLMETAMLKLTGNLDISSINGYITFGDGTIQTTAPTVSLAETNLFTGVNTFSDNVVTFNDGVDISRNITMNNGELSGNLSFNNDSNSYFAMDKGLEVNGVLNIINNYSLFLSNNNNRGILSYGTNINSNANFVMNDGLFLNGSLIFTNVNTDTYYASISQSGNNISINPGLDLNGALTIYDNTNSNYYSELSIFGASTPSTTFLILSTSLQVGNSSNSNVIDLYGNLNFTNSLYGTITTTGTSLLIDTVSLNLTGNIIFNNSFNGIQINNSSNHYLCFPSSTDAFNPSITPFGLGIGWNFYDGSKGETDLICYGGGSPNTGGLSIYSYNTPNGSANIANFWPSGSSINTTLNLNGNLNLYNNNIIASNNANLSFPSSFPTNPVTGFGLGFYWNQSGGNGETDIICYGAGAFGGLNIYATNSNYSPKLLASFTGNSLSDPQYIYGNTTIYTYFNIINNGLGINIYNTNNDASGNLSYGTNLNYSTDFVMNSGLYLNGNLISNAAQLVNQGTDPAYNTNATLYLNTTAPLEEQLRLNINGTLYYVKLIAV